MIAKLKSFKRSDVSGWSDRVPTHSALFNSYAMIILLYAGSSAMLWGFSQNSSQPNVTPKSATPTEQPKLTSDFNSIKASVSSSKFNALEDFQLTLGLDKIELSFAVHRLFEPGRADIKKAYRSDVRSIAELTSKFSSDYHISVSGTTDASPVVKNAHLFKSNWELSFARAAAFVRAFEKNGVSSNRISLTGYGMSRSAYNERLPSNASKKMLNRRIMIGLKRQ